MDLPVCLSRARVSTLQLITPAPTGTPQPWQRSVGSEILHRDGSAKDTTLPFDGCLFCYEQPHIVFLLFHSSSFHSPLSLTPAPGAQPQTFQLSQSCDVTPLPAGTCPFQDPAQHLLPRGASTTPAPSPGGRDSAVSTPAPSPQPLSPRPMISLGCCCSWPSPRCSGPDTSVVSTLERKRGRSPCPRSLLPLSSSSFASGPVSSLVPGPAPLPLRRGLGLPPPWEAASWAD